MPTVPHRASDYLKTPDAITAYVNVVLDDPESDREDLMAALRNVADAIGGVNEMPTVSHRTSDYLETPEAIAAHVNVVLDDPKSDCEDLRTALRNVADAGGGVSELSRRTGLNRAGLPRALSKIVKACGVRLRFSA